MNSDIAFLIPDETRPRIPKYVLAAISSWFGSLSMGTVIGYTAPAIPSLSDSSDMHLTTEQISLLGSLMALGALFGSIIAGLSIEYIGRKGTLMLSSVPFVSGWLLMAYSGNMANSGSSEYSVTLLIGRFITGFCCGLISLSAPVYIAETSNPGKRGFLGSGFQLSVTIGILLTYTAGKYLTWSQLALICCVYPIILLITMCFMPESPLWLISKGKVSAATEANVFLHGMQDAANNDMDFTVSSILSDGQTGESKRFQLSEFKKPFIYKPILLSMALMFFQQFSGVNAIIFYTTTIFESVRSQTLNSHDATIIIGAVQVVATLTACVLTDRAGRRLLFCVSSIGCGVSLGLMAVYYFVGDIKGDSFRQSFCWMPILALVLFMIFFSLGMGPIPWLLMGELLPAHVKSVASSLVSSFNWFCAFVITQNFQVIIDALNESGTYLSFSVFCFIGFIFVVILLPETKGKSLQEIENHFKETSTSQQQQQNEIN